MFLDSQIKFKLNVSASDFASILHVDLLDYRLKELFCVSGGASASRQESACRTFWSGTGAEVLSSSCRSASVLRRMNLSVDLVLFSTLYNKVMYLQYRATWN